MITLYHSPNTRSTSIVWLLEELGTPYKMHEVDWRHPDGTGKRDPANPHPHGKVPAITDDGETVFETSAISQTGPDHFVANGTLSLHGVKRPITLPFTLTIDKDVAKMDGSATLNRMDFSVGHGQAGGPETVSPQVSVAVKLTAHKAP